MQGGDKFKGQYVKGLKNGQGVQRFPNGSFIEGTWRDDRLLNGKATYAHSNSVYTGAFQDNRKHGQGSMISPEGSYSGNWINDEKNGRGTMRYSNEDRYEGEWKKGMKDGFG